MKILNKIIEDNKLEEDFYTTDMGLMNDLSNVLDVTLQSARAVFNKMKHSKDNDVVDTIAHKYKDVDKGKLQKIYKLIKKM